MLEFEEDIVCCGIGHGVTVLCVREIWDDGASGDIVFAMVPKEDIVLELAEENAGL